jgi:type II secretory pathway component PulF
MARFAWEGTTRSGEKRRGVIEAESKAVVEERLRGDNIQIQKVGREGGLGDINIQIGTGASSRR